MCGDGWPFLRPGFLHEEHEGDDAKEDRAHEPEAIEEGLHGRLALDQSVEQAVGLGRSLGWI